MLVDNLLRAWGEGGTHSLAHTQRKVGFDICEFVKGSVVSLVCVSAMGYSLAVGYSVLDYVIVPEIGMYNKTFRGQQGVTTLTSLSGVGLCHRLCSVCAAVVPPPPSPFFSQLSGKLAPRPQPVSSSRPKSFFPSSHTAPRHNKNSVHIVHIP